MNQYHVTPPSQQSDQQNKGIIRQVDDSYGGGSATDEGIMEYTPSLTNSYNIAANKDFPQQQQQQYFIGEGNLDEIIDHHYGQMQQQQQYAFTGRSGPPRPTSASSQGSRKGARSQDAGHK